MSLPNSIYLGDNLEVLRNRIEDSSIDLIYIDPPYNTGKTQKIHGNSYDDVFTDYLSFLKPRIVEAHRVLKPNGTLCIHLDWREAAYVRVMTDEIFGRKNFLNEIIWAYDYGARQKKKWATKHDNILIYVKDINNYVFNYDEIDRIPYMAPGLVGKEKAARGKTLTDCFWHTIVSTNGKERCGYPTQKPLGLVSRFIKVHSPKNGVVLDFFAGSGTTGVAAWKEGRHFILIDSNPQAIEVMKRRFSENLEIRRSASLNLENINIIQETKCLDNNI